MDLSVTLKDSSYNLQGVLVNPEGMPIDIQSTITKVTSSGPRYRNSLQLFRRDPEAGRWLFILFINGNASGLQTSMPFTGRIAFDAVKISSSGLPQDPKVRLGRGLAKTFVVNVKNTGSTVESLFVDPRLASTTTVHLRTIVAHLPLTSWGPSFTVPPEMTNLTVAALADTPNVPIDMDMLSFPERRPLPMSQRNSHTERLGHPTSRARNSLATTAISGRVRRRVRSSFWAMAGVAHAGRPLQRCGSLGSCRDQRHRHHRAVRCDG